MQELPGDLRDSREMRDFDHLERPGVRDFYAANHAGQTVAFVEAKRADYGPLRRQEMSVWDALESLGEIVDDSDPAVVVRGFE
jgi:hypothetical protein